MLCLTNSFKTITLIAFVCHRNTHIYLSTIDLYSTVGINALAILTLELGIVQYVYLTTAFILAAACSSINHWSPGPHLKRKGGADGKEDIHPEAYRRLHLPGQSKPLSRPAIADPWPPSY